MIRVSARSATEHGRRSCLGRRRGELRAPSWIHVRGLKLERPAAKIGAKRSAWIAPLSWLRFAPIGVERSLSPLRRKPAALRAHVTPVVSRLVTSCAVGPLGAPNQPQLAASLQSMRRSLKGLRSCTSFCAPVCRTAIQGARHRLPNIRSRFDHDAPSAFRWVTVQGA